jgi:hypothetical protein
METVIEKQFDKFGNEIKVGDKVAFVYRGWDGKRADLGKGIVTKLTPCGVRIKADKEYEKFCPCKRIYIEDKTQKYGCRCEREFLPKFSTSKLIIKL